MEVYIVVHNWNNELGESNDIIGVYKNKDDAINKTIDIYNKMEKIMAEDWNDPVIIADFDPGDCYLEGNSCSSECFYIPFELK